MTITTCADRQPDFISTRMRKVAPANAMQLAVSVVLVAIFFGATRIGVAQEVTTLTYPISPDNVQELVLLKVFGLVPKGKSDDDFGRKAEIRVADRLAVSDVPVDFLKASADAAITQTAALGLLPLKEGEQLEKLLSERKLDGKAATKALVLWWTMDMMSEWDPESKGNLSSQQLLALDKERAKSVGSLGTIPSEQLRAQWLLFPMGMDQFSPMQRVRKPATFHSLIERFDPPATIHKDNAVAAAEDLIWTWRIGLGDGKAATLPESRLVIQAHLVERLNFKIGDPLDPDETLRKSAREKLAAALKVCRLAWQNDAK